MRPAEYDIAIIGMVDAEALYAIPRVPVERCDVARPMPCEEPPPILCTCAPEVVWSVYVVSVAGREVKSRDPVTAGLLWTGVIVRCVEGIVRTGADGRGVIGVIAGMMAVCSCVVKRQ